MSVSRYTFFIAYSVRDRARALELRDLLHGEVAVFLDVCDLDPGDEWDVILPRRQKQSMATVVLLSDSADAAYYLREEIANAIAYQRYEPGAHRLIPVYLDGLPRDPLRIPYGLRVRHSLDARVLGMVGVADELKRMTVRLTDATTPMPPDALEAADRNAIFDELCGLLAPQFGEVLFRIDAPVHHLAPASEPLARRVLDVIQWAEQGGRSRIDSLVAAIRIVAPNSSMRSWNSTRGAGGDA